MRILNSYFFVYKDFILSSFFKGFNNNDRRFVLQNFKAFWKNTSQFRFLNVVSKNWEIEQSFRSFKPNVYLWTSTALLKQSRWEFFAMWSWYWRFDNWSWQFFDDWSWNWRAPVLALHTVKQNFINKLLKMYSIKDLLNDLKQIEELSQKWTLDEDFNFIPTWNTKPLEEKVISMLRDPVWYIRTNSSWIDINQDDEVIMSDMEENYADLFN
jgi:hypothetical protein